MTPFQRYLLIFLLIIAALVGTLILGYPEELVFFAGGAALVNAVRLGYFLSEQDHKHDKNEEIRMMSERIRELEEREKSRTSSGATTEKPPESE